MISFCDLSILRNLINIRTCYKNFDNLTSIDLILTYRPSYFQCNTAFEAGLSGFHLLTTVFKNESLQLSNTVLQKLWNYFSSDLKYSSTTLITMTWEHLKKLFLMYSINTRQLKESMFAPMTHLLWPKSFIKQLWKGLD